VSGLVDEPDWAAEDPLQLATLMDFLADRSYVWLYRSSGDIGARRVGEYSALLPPEAVERALADPGWEVTIGDGAPGFCSGTDESGEWVTEYERYSERDGAQLLVLFRSFDGVRPSHLELVEELRLLFNLWEDRRTGTFYEFGPSGEPSEVASVTERGVKAQRSLVRRYQAAKQMHLALFIDSTNHAADLPKGQESWERADDSVTLLTTGTGSGAVSAALSPGCLGSESSRRREWKTR
jgi:hypothetical protein